MSDNTIIYTKTDEAPALATYSFLPIIRAFAEKAGISVEFSDISLAGRIVSQFPECLDESQRINDELSRLGELTNELGTNIIKLPNISASVPQLVAAIKELQAKGYKLPDYPDNPQTDAENDIRARYDKIKGSAVNPVLREGNSDRRAPSAVKAYARKHPHSMGAWSSDSKTEVATMGKDDFFSNEKSITSEKNQSVRFEFKDADGNVVVLKDSLQLMEGEVLDGTFMSKKALEGFLSEQIEKAKAEGVLFSLHMKATMMKVSDPIIFGHTVKVFFADLVEKYASVLSELGVDFNNGLGDLIGKLDALSAELKAELENAINAIYEQRPDLAMVNSDKGITNLHVPSDVIVDASMPAMIRSSGKMWNKEGELQDTLAVIPDSSYASVYQAVVDFCKENGAFDPTTMGSVSNVGLMAKKAEEYGSHDKTFEMPSSGTVSVIGESGEVLFSHDVEEGDIWRACQTKDLAIQDWIKLAVRRARETGNPAVFWLNEERSHDVELIKKVSDSLEGIDTEGLELHILPPREACLFSLQRIKDGQDTISATGNVLRDYLTDLFPILEVGTSAKMLSIVPLIKGGGLFETGAGGSAPKHVQQFIAENYLRWDSLGEFLALAVSLEHFARVNDNSKAGVLGKALDSANERFLDSDKSPTRRLGGIDNRGSQYYLCRFWAESLAEQAEDVELKNAFQPIAKALAEGEEKIIEELISVQGKPVDIGGYYIPDEAKATVAMRPSQTFNTIIDQL